MPTYKIVRHYEAAYIGRRTIKTGLTLAEAQAWTEDPDTSSITTSTKVGKARTRKIGHWFDGYVEEK